MKILNQIVGTIIILTGFTNIALADTKEQTIEQGQTKYVTLKMAGAFTASSVKVTGVGITANIYKKYPNKIKIKLKSNKFAKAGLRDIRVKLMAGTNKTPLYVFGIKNAQIDITGPAKTGKFQKVAIGLPVIAGTISIISNCIGSQEGSYSPGRYARQWFPVKRTPNQRFIWVSSNNNRNAKSYCSLKITEFSTIKKKASSVRTVRVQFNQDNNVPTHLTPPQIRTADKITQNTRNRSGNSPSLKWNNSVKANAYEVYYKKYQPYQSVPTINASAQGWSKRTITKNSSIPNLKIGTYAWCIKAKHIPRRPSILSMIKSDCSVIRSFNIKQIN